MSEMILGTQQNDQISGANADQMVVGLAGDDQITTAGGADTVFGDFMPENMLSGSDGATSFSQYGESGAWTVEDLGNGHQSITQTVETVPGGEYTVSFEAAANIGDGHLSGTVEVLWNGEVIDTINTADAGFSGHALSLIGTGGADALTFRSVEPQAEASGPTIQTDAPIYYYETQVEIGGEMIAVDAVAPGQPKLFQVMNGTLHVFDVQTETYTKAGSDATVVTNGFGFNQEDDLFYGIAVKNGVDALGTPISRTDIVMMDAKGDTYRLGEGPYASWTGDFDDQGNLWSFHSSMDRVTVIDVDQKDAQRNPVTTVYKFPKDLVKDAVWDVAYNAADQKFYGVVRPKDEGDNGKLLIVDVSQVANGGEPIFSTVEITGTRIDGQLKAGLPAITFGAAIVDSDGNLYVGGNGGDHDMNDATGSAGGIYRVSIDPVTGTAVLELVTAAPKAYSNDGAADPRAIDPFMETDPGAVVLIRTPELVATPSPSDTYDDVVEVGGSSDTVYGGFGQDTVIGDSAGDVINGDGGNDYLYGGAGPDSLSTVLSFYDEEGNRYDQYGNLLAEEDDVIFGGAGDDLVSGSAGHDVLHGDAGNDALSGGTGADRLYGGSGQDDLSGGREDDVLFGGAGDDVLTGGSGEDALSGDDGDDVIKGGSGRDVIDGGHGDDSIDGGSGDDQITGGAGKDRIKAGSGNDWVDAGAGNDYLNGYRGDDVLLGGEGKDTFYLGAGNDVAYGGAGADRFVFRFEDLDGSTDTIMDFTRDSGEKDRLDFRALDLLSDGMTEDAWLSQYLSQSATGDVTIALDGLNLVLEDHQDLGSQFLQNVADAIEF